MAQTYGYARRIIGGFEGRTMRDKAQDCRDYRIMLECGVDRPGWAKRLVAAYQGMTEAEQQAAELA